MAGVILSCVTSSTLSVNTKSYHLTVEKKQAAENTRFSYFNFSLFFAVKDVILKLNIKYLCIGFLFFSETNNNSKNKD